MKFRRTNTSSLVNNPVLLTCLQLFMKQIIPLNIVNVLFKVNLHTKLLTKNSEMVVVATTSVIFSLFNLDSSLLVIAGSPGQCLLSANH